MKAQLILENGMRFSGTVFGAEKKHRRRSSFHNRYDRLSGNSY